MPDGVADRLGQIGNARNPVDMLVLNRAGFAGGFEA